MRQTFPFRGGTLGSLKRRGCEPHLAALSRFEMTFQERKVNSNRADYLDGQA